MRTRGYGYARYGIAIAAVLAILARMLWPDLKFDEISLVLLVIGAIALLLTDIDGVVSRIKKIKGGEFEIEFDTVLTKLAGETEKLEQKIDEQQAKGLTVSVPATLRSEDLLRLTANPRGALVAVAVEIERAVRELAEYYAVPAAKKAISPVRVVDELVNRRYIPEELASLTRDFWVARNSAVHSIEFQPSSNQLYELLDLGLRLVRLLSIRRVYVETARERVHSEDPADVIAGADILSELGDARQDVPLLEDALKRHASDSTVKETLERAIRDLRRVQLHK